jgi:chromosome segregation ATPase
MADVVAVGTIPQWGMFVTFLVAILGVWLKLRQQQFDFSSSDRKTLGDKIQRLEKKVEDCEAREQERIGEIKELHEEIFGLRKQHIQEQISFARAIIESLGKESPQLNVLLTAMENGHRALEAQRKIHQLTGVRGDILTEKGNEDG